MHPIAPSGRHFSKIVEPESPLKIRNVITFSVRFFVFIEKNKKLRFLGISIGTSNFMHLRIYLRISSIYDWKEIRVYILENNQSGFKV